MGERTTFNLSKEGQLLGYKHSGFWYPMDTIRQRTFGKFMENAKLSLENLE